MSQSVRSAPGRQPGQSSAPTSNGLGSNGPGTNKLGTNGLGTNGLGSGGGSDRPLVDRVFGPDEITLVRHEVSGRLTAAGLRGDRLDGFVLAVNEVVTNVVLHAGGQGRVTLRLSEGSAWCTVTDSGPGIPAHFLSAAEVPGTFEVSGRGIWLAYQLCDEVTVATGPIGTTVGMRISLTPV